MSKLGPSPRVYLIIHASIHKVSPPGTRVQIHSLSPILANKTVVCGENTACGTGTKKSRSPLCFRLTTSMWIPVRANSDVLLNGTETFMRHLFRNSTNVFDDRLPLYFSWWSRSRTNLCLVGVMVKSPTRAQHRQFYHSLGPVTLYTHLTFTI